MDSRTLMLIITLKMKSLPQISIRWTVVFLMFVGIAPLATSAVSEKPWALHDVSILFPLPETLPSSPDFSGLAMGERGRWLPDSILRMMPSLEATIMPDRFAEVMQVVGVRFETNEIRLVWQPLAVQVLPTGKTEVRSIDAALHSFYRFTDAEFSNILSELKTLNTEYSEGSVSDPLLVHPVLAREGWKGPYGQGLRKILMTYVGEQNLSRVTFMTVLLANLQWHFGGYDIVDGEPKAMVIPKIPGNAGPLRPTNIQIFVNNAFPPTEFFGGIGPAPKDQEDLNRLMSDSRKETADQVGRFTRAHATIGQIENPNVRSDQNTDCVSCHIAEPARRFIEARMPELKGPHADSYIAQIYNLTNTSPDRDRTDNIRNFGYFGSTPSVSQRVIHDTAKFALSL